MSAKNENIERALKNIGNRILRESRINLDKARKKDTGNLRRSLGFKVIESEGGYSVNMLASNYAKFIDQGRPPSRGGGSRPGSLRMAIEKWVQRNRFKLRGSAANLRRDSRRGNFGALKPYQIRSLAFAISQKIHKVGFVGIEFISDAFRTSEPFISKSLSDAYKEDIKKEIEKIINNKING